MKMVIFHCYVSLPKGNVNKNSLSPKNLSNLQLHFPQFCLGLNETFSQDTILLPRCSFWTAYFSDIYNLLMVICIYNHYKSFDIIDPGKIQVPYF